MKTIRTEPDPPMRPTAPASFAAAAVANLVAVVLAVALAVLVHGIFHH